jgi:hypothetical protein
MTWSLSWRLFFLLAVCLALLLFLAFLSGDVLAGRVRRQLARRAFFSSRAARKQRRLERRREALLQLRSGMRTAAGFHQFL